MDLALPWLPTVELTVDGRDLEPAWSEAATLGEPVPYAPNADVDPVGHVETRALAEPRGLWVYAKVTDPEPALVRAGLGRRDSRWDDDQVGVLIDPEGDGRRAYVFTCNALGVQFDRLHLPGHMFDVDTAWDGTWSCAGRRTESGYELEIFVPWSAARMGGTLDRFGLLVLREVPRTGMSSAWPAVPVGTDALLSAARVHADGRVPSRIGLELRPELTGAWADPPIDDHRLGLYGVSPGLTVRWDPGGAVAGVATFNPDYSQLESDATQIDVNARYALYYEEKRPFFLEGQDWFSHPISSALYTRTVGAPLYGVRATAQGGPVGVAVLNTLDMAPRRTVNEGGGWTDADVEGKEALVSLVRARVGLGGDAYVGLLGSDRTVLGTDLSNRVLGLDGRIRLEKRAWIDVAALGSATVLGAGEQPTLAPAARVDANWSGEAIWARLRLDGVGQGFRQENGFFTYEDRAGAVLEAHYNLHPSYAVPLIALEPVDVWEYHRFDGSLRDRGWDPSVWASFGNGAMVKLDGRVATEEYAGKLVNYENTELYASLSTGAVRLEAGGTLGSAPVYDDTAPRAGRYLEGWVWAEIQPVSRFTLGLSPVVADMAELDTGDPIFTAWTVRARAELFLTREGWLRLVAERAELGSVAWRIEPVAGWEWAPGRAIYAGGSWSDEDGDVSWQVFGKLGWSFTI